MARMIDGDALTERLRVWLESPHGENAYNSGYDDALWHVLDVIEHMPTLTQPNEGAKDKNVPTNEPLTLEELREMDRHPVWVKLLKPNKYINPPAGWRILEKSLAGTFGVWDGEDNLVERDYGTDWLAYRRPLEGEYDG